MSLISFSFFCFIALVFWVYYSCPKHFQWIVLLVANLAFFCFAGTPWTIIYLLSSSTVTWFAGRKIAEQNTQKENAKGWFILALTVDVGLLVLLKYTNFILGNVSAIFSMFSCTQVNWKVSWPAALGMSYYTLQTVGYLLDCWWGTAEPQQYFWKFLLFTSFFPQMISGPISRYEQLKTELFQEHIFDKKNLLNGILRIICGVFKKLVIAENIGIVAAFLLGDNPSYKFSGFLLFGAPVSKI